MKEKLDDSFYIKIRRLAEKKKYFTTNELFLENPRTPSHLLRQALVELREAKEVFMHGSKKTAVYSFSEESPYTDSANSDDEDNESTASLTSKKQIDPELEQGIKNEIQRTGFAVIPHLMDKFKQSRSVVTDTLNKLIQDQFIYKTGEKKGTKYIWHNKSEEDIEKVISIKRNPIIDRLQPILCKQGMCIGIGGNHEKSWVKTYDNGRPVKVENFTTVEDSIKHLYSLTNKIHDVEVENA